MFPKAINGIWHNCNTNRTKGISQHPEKLTNRFECKWTKCDARTCIVNRYILIFFVTTAITSSCTAALNKNVKNIADLLDNLYDVMVEAYTWRSKNMCTGRFHFRENSSQEVEFHLRKARVVLECLGKTWGYRRTERDKKA